MKEELFRAELVALVSSLDYYLFEILKTGIIQIQNRERETTTGFQKLRLPMKYVITALENPGCLSWLPEAIVELFGVSSFQSLKQIEYVLKIISNKSYKAIMNEIAIELSTTRGELESQLKGIFKRRNQIAHNCDIPHDCTMKQNIEYHYLKESIFFIQKFIKYLHNSIII